MYDDANFTCLLIIMKHSLQVQAIVRRATNKARSIGVDNVLEREE